VSLAALPAVIGTAMVPYVPFGELRDRFRAEAHTEEWSHRRQSWLGPEATWCRCRRYHLIALMGADISRPVATG
jgi:hypothetical protein